MKGIKRFLTPNLSYMDMFINISHFLALFVTLVPFKVMKDLCKCHSDLVKGNQNHY